MVGPHPELAARFQLGRDHVERAGVHEPALGVAHLWPGIGMEQINALQRSVGQALQHVQRVAHMHADIRKRPVADMHERADDAVQERFAADERSEEHTSEPKSLMRISYAVFRLTKKTIKNNSRKAS